METEILTPIVPQEVVPVPVEEEEEVAAVV